MLVKNLIAILSILLLAVNTQTMLVFNKPIPSPVTGKPAQVTFTNNNLLITDDGGGSYIDSVDGTVVRIDYSLSGIKAFKVITTQSVRSVIIRFTGASWADSNNGNPISPPDGAPSTGNYKVNFEVYAWTGFPPGNKNVPMTRMVIGQTYLATVGIRFYNPNSPTEQIGSLIHSWAFVPESIYERDTAIERCHIIRNSAKTWTIHATPIYFLVWSYAKNAYIGCVQLGFDITITML